MWVTLHVESYGIFFLLFSQLGKNVLEKQDRKVSFKLPLSFLCKTYS